MRDGNNGTNTMGRTYGLVALALALFLVVVAMAARFGLPDTVTGFLFVAMTIVAYLAVGLGVRTLSSGTFYIADRQLPSAFAGLVAAATFISAAGFIGIGGAFFANPAAGLAVTVGWIMGFALLTIAIGPFYRKSGAISLPDFLAVRYGGVPIRVLGVIILICCGLPLLTVSISVCAKLIEGVVSIGSGAAVTVTCAILAATTLFGGMRSVALVAGLQAIVMLFGVLVPAGVFSTEIVGIPVPQLTYGSALAEVNSALETGFGALASEVLPVLSLDGFNLFALAVSLAAGIAALPHVVIWAGTTNGITASRQAMGWALGVVALIAATAPAAAAFVELSLLRNIVGVEGSFLPTWLFDFSEAGLLTICGETIGDLSEMSAACGATAIIGGLEADQLALAPDMTVLAFADMTGLPFVFTALIGAAAIAAALATAGATLISISTSVGHDLFAGTIGRRASGGRRLMVSRAALIICLVGAGWIAHVEGGVDRLVNLAISVPTLAASGLFPALVLGIWWNRTTRLGAIAGMATGFAVSAFYVLSVTSETIAPLVLAGSDLSPASFGLTGASLGLTITIVVSLFTPAPGSSRSAVIEAIRSPAADPILEDHAL